MADSPDGVGDLEYTPRELRQMDEQEARQTLTVAQFERWESIQDLYEEAEQTQAEWDAESETVSEVAIHADMAQLGTEVEVFGNDLVVYLDPEERQTRQALQRLEDEYSDIDVDALEETDDERLDELVDLLLDLLDAALVEWNGTRWADLSEAKRDTTLADIYSAWGTQALMLAWLEITQAIQADREARIDQIESFRGA